MDDVLGGGGGDGGCRIVASANRNFSANPFFKYFATCEKIGSENSKLRVSPFRCSYHGKLLTKLANSKEMRPLPKALKSSERRKFFVD
jgi:hypothetical protein